MRGLSRKSGKVLLFGQTFAFAALVALLSSADAAADDKPPAVEASTWMREAEIRAAFDGATLEGKYGSGRPFSETYGKDGRIQYRERGTVIGGRWSVEADTFCTIYDTDPTGGCYRVIAVTGNCYEFYFIARSEEQARQHQQQPAWTARGSVVGRPGSCADQHSV